MKAAFQKSIHKKSLMILLGLAISAFLTNGFVMAQEAWVAPAEAKGYKNTQKKTAASVEAGKKVYLKYCVLCHGGQGKGDGASSGSLEVKPADFTDQKRMKAQTDGELAWKILSGRGPMPAWGPVLQETDIWDVINYVRSLAK